MKSIIFILLFIISIIAFIHLKGQSYFYINQLDTVSLTRHKVNGVHSFVINRPISYNVSFNFSNSIVRDNFDSIVSSLEGNIVKDSLILTKANSALKWSERSDRLDVFIGELVPISVVQSVLYNFLDDSISNFTISLLMDERSSYGLDTYTHRQISLSSGSYGARWNHRMVNINDREDLMKIIALSSNKELVDYFKKNHANPLALKREEQRLEKFRYWLKEYEDIDDFSLRLQLSMKKIEKYLQRNIISKTENEARKYKRYDVVLRINTEGIVTSIDTGLEKYGFSPEEIEDINSALYSLPEFASKEKEGFICLYLSY